MKSLVSVGALVALSVALPLAIDKGKAALNVVSKKGRAIWDRFCRKNRQLDESPPPSEQRAHSDDQPCSPDSDHVCPVCQEVFLEPVTTSCGHTFCKHCLAQWVGKKIIGYRCAPNCPLCRVKLLPGSVGYSKELTTRVSKLYPEVVSTRKHKFLAAGGLGNPHLWVTPQQADEFGPDGVTADHWTISNDPEWFIQPEDDTVEEAGNVDQVEADMGNPLYVNPGGEDEGQQPLKAVFPWWRHDVTLVELVTCYYGPSATEQHRRHAEWMMYLAATRTEEDEYYNGTAQDYEFYTEEEEAALGEKYGWFLDSDRYAVYKKDHSVPRSYLDQEVKQYGNLNHCLPYLVSKECVERYWQMASQH